MAQLFSLGDFTFMKPHRILGILWAVFCGYSCFNLFPQLFSIHPTAAGLWFAWGVIAAMFLMDLTGVVASIFLFRGARWPRSVVGLIAVYTAFGGIGFIIMTRSLPAWSVATSVFALVSLSLLLLPRHEPVA